MLASERRASDAELTVTRGTVGAHVVEQTSPGNVANDSFFEGSFRRGNAEEKDSESDS